MYFILQRSALYRLNIFADWVVLNVPFFFILPIEIRFDVDVVSTIFSSVVAYWYYFVLLVSTHYC